ncbi:protein kinase [Thermodesulfobacteriota bacterium]
MDRKTALTVLGLNVDASEKQVEVSYQTQRQKIEDLMNFATTELLKTKYQAELLRLREAHAAASGTITPNGPAGGENGFDLPTSGPSVDTGGFITDDEPSLNISANWASLEPGQLVSSRYEILAKSGECGLGPVYAATDRETREERSIITIPPGLFTSEADGESLAQQARVVAGLSHPNVLRVFELHRDGNDLFFTTEIMEGESLRGLMERRKAARKPFSVAGVKNIQSSLCSALEYEHQLAVHLDVRPENAWVFPDGTVKLIDFGLGRLRGSKDGPSGFGPTAHCDYMAPEVVSNPLEADERADQYSVAAVLYEMLTGRCPTGRAESARSVRREVPYFVSGALEKAMSEDPGRRFTNMKAFDRRLSLGATGTNKVVALVVVLLMVVIGAGTYTLWKPMAQQIRTDPWLSRNIFDRTYYNLVTEGETKFKAGEYDGAVKHFDEALKQKPGGSEAKTGQDKALRARTIQEARTALGRKNYAQAKASLLEYADDEEARDLLTEAEYGMAMKEGTDARKKKKWQRALEAYNRALSLKKKDEDASDAIRDSAYNFHLDRGKLYLQNDRYKRALGEMAKARKLKPNDTGALQQVGKLEKMANDGIAADLEKKCDEQIEIANKYMVAKKFKLAILACEQALDYKKGDPRATALKKGNTAFVKGDLQKAIKYLREYMELTKKRRP